MLTAAAHHLHALAFQLLHNCRQALIGVHPEPKLPARIKSPGVDRCGGDGYRMVRASSDAAHTLAGASH